MGFPIREGLGAADLLLECCLSARHFAPSRRFSIYGTLLPAWCSRCVLEYMSLQPYQTSSAAGSTSYNFQIVHHHVPHQIRSMSVVYLFDTVQFVSAKTTSSGLRSVDSTDFYVPRLRIKFEERAFALVFKLGIFSVKAFAWLPLSVPQNVC